MSNRIRNRVETLRLTIRQHDRLYYVQNTLEISDEDAEKILTVQDSVDYLKDLGQEDG